MPACVKAVSEWFPMRERALAVGIFNSGTAIGAAAAAPIVAAVTLHFGWRSMFIVGGALSAAWLVAWLLAYRAPDRHPWITPEELAVIREDGSSPESPGPVPTRRILATPEAWGCILARVLTDPISYFFAYWVPLFLQEKRGFDLAALGKWYWIPYVGLGLGNLASGAVPGWLIRRGWPLNRARKTVMFAAACVIACCFVLITRVPSPGWALALIGGAMFCHAAWASMTLPAEVFPQHLVGSVSGFAGALGSLVSAITMLAIGRTVMGGSFVPIFIIYSALPMVGFALVCALIPKLGVVLELTTPSRGRPSIHG
jgi:MFS transporter, ACS family, hexuronate transporter